ncbi:Nitrogen regulation protein NR(I) [hydrothermal vent metagenome]|uniref:Nitrogen regulation protein NR(I) n=1 Tax=hydrothermal vent metagenome TaxID=652676 RepID=A0A3B0TRU7_9ZZZZ
MLSRSERLKRARITLMQGGQVGGNLANPQIVQSWERCLALGLDPNARPACLQVSENELRRLRERDELAHRFAVGEMHALYQQIAGSNFLIAFGNSQGIVLETVADGNFKNSDPGKAIVAGAIWSEEKRGTNALGTCARDMHPIIVHGEEHFFVDHCDVSCFAAPIFHSDGMLAGVLDASSDCSARHAHTLALMRMAATHMENSLFLAQQDEHIVVLFHSRWELLNSVSGGLASFDTNGRLNAINQRGKEILRGLSVRPGVAFETIFDISFSAALAEMADSHHPTLRDLLGSRYSVLWRNRHSFEKRIINAPARPENSPPGEIKPKAEIKLDPARGFVASDPRVRHLLGQVERAVKFNPPFLIQGESGTGKEVLARHIHKSSKRKGKFVAINCGALPEQLLEAELFGYVAGAFTGAHGKGSDGLAVAADKGTLFLDEIGDLAMAGQVALLRFLDSSEVRPVGGTKSQKLDLQIITASNINLDNAVAAKKFREDLYFRLGVVKLELPPLRMRNDFGEIVEQMLLEISPEHRITPDGALMLALYPWRGNIRELRSRLLQLVMSASETVISSGDVEALLGATPDNQQQTGPVSLKAKIGRQVTEMLQINGNNISLTARELGVSRNTVYKYARNGNGTSFGEKNIGGEKGAD